MNIVFMGTPDFSVPCLEELIKAKAVYNIQCVFTQTDKPKDRGHKLQSTPVKECAVSHNIDVFQPVSLKKGEDGEKSLKLLKELNPDCIAVAAYGKILPKEILDIPRYGCINVHAGLLPDYRGASPINHCIINGENQSGVTIQYMAEGIDTGDIILKQSCEINSEMTATQLHDKLSVIGARLLIKALAQLEAGTAERTPQTGNSCYAPLITKEMCCINWSKSAVEVHNLIRGLSEKPAAFTFMSGKRLKVYLSCLEEKIENVKEKAGTIIDTDKFTVVCGDGKAVSLTDIQLEGNKRMDSATFLRGRKLEKGIVLD